MAGKIPTTEAEHRQASFLAGWTLPFRCPDLHTLPPPFDPILGHNGVAAPVEGDPDFYAWRHNGPNAMFTDLRSAVLDEHWGNVGFVEGPANNQNPWGEEQGAGWAAYCNSGACMVPYHCGYRWPDSSQFGEKGFAYTVWHVEQGVGLGQFRYDHTSDGDPADVEPCDLTFWAWTPGATTPDHVETAVETRLGGGRIHCVGYNTGSPEGCHETWRDDRYFLGRLRWLPGGGPPTPPADTDPFRRLGRQFIPLGV